MHNEELGLLKREITELYESLSQTNKDILDDRLQHMPVVPNFPKITVSLKKPGIFKAKHWIVISKYICCAVHGIRNKKCQHYLFVNFFLFRFSY